MPLLLCQNLQQQQNNRNIEKVFIIEAMCRSGIGICILRLLLLFHRQRRISLALRNGTAVGGREYARS